jgi:hypothetical protein
MHTLLMQTSLRERAMETRRLVQAIVIPVLAFAAVILVAVAFGMFLHVVPHGSAPAFALGAVLIVTIGAAVISSASPSHG